MTTAYAALLSLFHTLNHIEIHPRPPISLDHTQVESLTQNLTFLLDFLERYSSEEDDELESRMAAAAYAAEDVIETRIVDRIHAQSNIPQGLGRVKDLIKKKAMNILGLHHSDLYGGLKIVIKEMDLIKTEVMHIIQHRPHLHTNSPLPPTSRLQSSTMAVFDDAIIIQVLDKLVGQQISLQIVPIVGMGGIGKTTFASNIYQNPLIVQYFDVRAWVTISQEYSRKHILQLLCQEVKVSKKVSCEMSEDEIGLVLYQNLCGRRYLIVMDDMWSIDAWDKVKSFFPNNNNGSRIMVTTRLSNLAFELSGCHGFQMQFLDEDKSWDLLCEIVFGKLDCPIELDNVGKEIARKCRGLPLSIGVIGGLLRKSNMTREYWIYTLKNLNSLINLENDEYAFRILHTSYKELSMHLKPCFLYMGIFPEDKEIRVSMLIELWVAEGILRPIDDKSLRKVAKEYLEELIDRNLILVAKCKWNREAKECKIHDVLRDVCLREAQKQNFLCVVRQQEHHTPQVIHKEHRICINHENAKKRFNPEFLHGVESASLTRSLLYCMHASRGKYSPSVHLGLLRVYSSVDDQDHELETVPYDAIFKHANLRYLSLKLKLEAVSSLRYLCCLLWNVQTLKVGHPYPYPNRPMMAPSEIWEMPLLKHVMLYNFVLPDPPNVKHNFVLKYLHTLSGIMNLKFSEEVIKRIPNVKKLKVIYQWEEDDDLPNFCIKNIGRLKKLESLSLDVEKIRWASVSFPRSLKKLSLRGTKLSWEELTKRIGSLPLLQVLKLDSYGGSKWETVEGQLCSLRLLQLSFCFGLKYWETDNTHFPRLEHLRLYYIEILKEIPSSIGDITTLKSIRLKDCNKSIKHSAKRIKVEQEENGNEDLQIIIVDLDEEAEEEGEGVDSDAEDI